MNHFSARENPGDLAEPALHYFDIDSQRHDVEAADLNPLSPMRRSFRVEVIAVKTLEPDLMRAADVILGQQLFYHQIASHPVRRRAKHRYQFRKSFGGREHFFSLSQVH